MCRLKKHDISNYDFISYYSIYIEQKCNDTGAYKVNQVF